MRAIYARKPRKEERKKLESGLKSSDGATVRRSQIILMSADERKTAREISERIGQSDQQIRKVLHAFNEQGTILATSGFDGTVRLWGLDLDEELSALNSNEELSLLTDQPLPLEGVDFSPDGRYVVAAGEDGMVRVFVVDIEDLMVLAQSRLSRDFTLVECQEYRHLLACED